MRAIECIWLSEEHARTRLLDYFYFVVFVSFPLIFVILFVCLFPVHSHVSLRLPATGF